MSLLAVKSYIWSKTFLFPMIVHDHEDHPPMVPIAAVAIYDEPPPFSMDKRKFRKKKEWIKHSVFNKLNESKRYVTESVTSHEC